MLIVINPEISGIAGNMILGALLDLGASESIIKKLEAIPAIIENCERLKITIKKEKRGAISGTIVQTNIQEDAHHVPGKKAKKRVRKVGQELEVEKPVMNFTTRVLENLLTAEAAVHNTSVDEIRLHETGSVDTIVDILGTGMLLKDLGWFKQHCYTLPVAVGGGTIETAHGKLSAPAPATLEILRASAIPFQGGPVKTELGTPTGVALLVEMIDKAIEYFPFGTAKMIGYGLGAKNLKEIPNALQIVAGSSSKTIENDEIYILRTNIDDVTGEILGYTMDYLLKEVALDVTITPTTMKKSRAAYVLNVIVKEENLSEAARIIMEETGSLGVRFHKVGRYKAKRTIEMIKMHLGGEKIECPVKISYLNGKLLKVKAEYDDVKKIAERLNRPLRKIKDKIEQKAQENLGSDENATEKD